MLILHESPPARNGLLMTTGTQGRLPGSRRGVALEHEIGQMVMSIQIDATFASYNFLALARPRPTLRLPNQRGDGGRCIS